MNSLSIWRMVGGWSVLVLVFALGVWCCAQWYRPQLQALEVQLVDVQHLADAAVDQMQRQNAAVAQLEADTRSRERSAVTLLEQGRRQAEADYARATRIMLEPSRGENGCEAARRAFAAELEEERRP